MVVLLVALSVGDGKGFQNLSHVTASILARCLCYGSLINELANVNVTHIIPIDFTVICKSTPGAERAIVDSTRGQCKAIRYNSRGSLKQGLSCG